MAKKKVLILIKPNSGKTADEVAAAVSGAGIKVKQVLPGPGIISGEARSDKAIQRVRELDEIATIREDKSVTIKQGDPDKK